MEQFYKFAYLNMANLWLGRNKQSGYSTFENKLKTWNRVFRLRRSRFRENKDWACFEHAPDKFFNFFEKCPEKKFYFNFRFIFKSNRHLIYCTISAWAPCTTSVIRPFLSSGTIAFFTAIRLPLILTEENHALIRSARPSLFCFGRFVRISQRAVWCAENRPRQTIVNLLFRTLNSIRRVVWLQNYTDTLAIPTPCHSAIVAFFSFCSNEEKLSFLSIHIISCTLHLGIWRMLVIGCLIFLRDTSTQMMGEGEFKFGINDKIF